MNKQTFTATYERIGKVEATNSVDLGESVSEMNARISRKLSHFSPWEIATICDHAQVELATLRSNGF